MNKKMYIAGGCFWGETVWETGARGCQLFWKNSDNLYSSCKE